VCVCKQIVCLSSLFVHVMGCMRYLCQPFFSVRDAGSRSKTVSSGQNYLHNVHTTPACGLRKNYTTCTTSVNAKSLYRSVFTKLDRTIVPQCDTVWKKLTSPTPFDVVRKQIDFFGSSECPDRIYSPIWCHDMHL